MINKIVIFIGSKKDYNKFLKKEISNDEETVSFMELIQHYNAKLRPADSAYGDNQNLRKRNIGNCIVKADDYASVLEHVMSNFVNLVTLNNNIDTLFVQNPPKRVLNSLKSEYEDIITYKYSKYPNIDRKKLKTIWQNLNKDVIGQIGGKKKVVSAMYKLTTNKKDKPVVLLLYGPSGVGKTETAKSISKTMGGELLRIQFSMMQTNEAYNYIFGSEHSKSSMAKELELRESNVVLFDEFDKINEIFYNAFYELFDEGTLEDTNYKINLSKCIFICTSNFESEEEIKKTLGAAMYSRIGACIQYEQLVLEEKEIIVRDFYDEMLKNLKADEIQVVEKSNILRWFLNNISRYDNIRILKTKLETAFFETLTEKFIFEELT